MTLLGVIAAAWAVVVATVLGLSFAGKLRWHLAMSRFRRAHEQAAAEIGRQLAPIFQELVVELHERVVEFVAEDDSGDADHS